MKTSEFFGTSKTLLFIAILFILGCNSPGLKYSTENYMLYDEAADPNLVDPVEWVSVPESLSGVSEVRIYGTRKACRLK